LSPFRGGNARGLCTISIFGNIRVNQGGKGWKIEGIKYTEPVFLNVYEAQESIPRNEFHHPM
jgi:hypothetical protein